MNEPKISVIVPVYNAIKYLNETLESLLAVTDTKIEIILVDDGSTDGSGELCDSINDARVRVIHKENGGVSSARNIGIEAARGEWISFVDADDIVMPDMYSSLLNSAESHGADVVQCAMMCKEENGSERVVFSPKKELVLKKPFSPKKLFQNLCYGCCSKIYKRSLVEKNRFDTRFAIGEDLMFNIATLETAEKIIITKKVGYQYVQHEDSATRTATSGKKLLSFRNMLKAALSASESPTLTEYMTLCQLNNNTDVISKIILNPSSDYSDTVKEIRRECRQNAALILLFAVLSAKQRFKLLAIGYAYGLYSQLLRKKKGK